MTCTSASWRHASTSSHCAKVKPKYLGFKCCIIRSLCSRDRAVALINRQQRPPIKTFQPLNKASTYLNQTLERNNKNFHEASSGVFSLAHICAERIEHELADSSCCQRGQQLLGATGCFDWTGPPQATTRKKEDSNVADLGHQRLLSGPLAMYWAHQQNT